MPLKLTQHENGFWYVSGTVTVWRDGRAMPREVRLKSTKTRDFRQADAIRRQIEDSVAEQNITGREPTITFNAAADRYVKNGGEDRYLATKEVAEKSGIHVNTLYCWKTGKASASVLNMEAALAVLGLELVIRPVNLNQESQ